MFNQKPELYKTVMTLPIKPEELKGRLMINEPMSRHTSWRVGGVADRLYVPNDIDDLKNFINKLDLNEPVTWIGLGSNLLVRDGGIRGTVIATKNMEDKINILSPTEIKVGAGTSCAQISKFSVNAGLIGAEFLVGIPGTLGGALVMNAGAFDCETWDIVKYVMSINRKGEIKKRQKSEFEISYRSITKPDNEWFVSAVLELSQDKTQSGHTVLREFLKKRSKAQPIGEASCGSVFKNPDCKNAAAKLIDDCGLKGKTCGDAMISEKHANFIINKGNATAKDIEHLIQEIQKIVYTQCKIRLMPEVKIIGEEILNKPIKMSGHL